MSRKRSGCLRPCLRWRTSRRSVLGGDQVSVSAPVIPALVTGMTKAVGLLAFEHHDWNLSARAASTDRVVEVGREILGH